MPPSWEAVRGTEGVLVPSLAGFSFAGSLYRCRTVLCNTGEKRLLEIFHSFVPECKSGFP